MCFINRITLGGLLYKEKCPIYKKEKNTMLEMVTSAFNLTCWWLCPPLTDGSDHDLTAIPLNLIKKFVRKSRG